MTESNSIPAPEAALLAGTERRIHRAMVTLGAIGTIFCLLWRGWGWGAGFAVGAVLSALNFRWMATAAHALADAASGQTAVPAKPLRRSAGVWLRFLFRYALIGLAGYAIFKSSFISLGAFFFGLFLFIAAILAEICYQVYGAFRSE